MYFRTLRSKMLANTIEMFQFLDTLHLPFQQKHI